MKHRVLFAVMGISALILAGCKGTGADADVTNENFELSSACSEFLNIPTETLETSDATNIHYNVLIEVTNNSEDNQKEILTRIRPIIDCAVYNGSYLSVTLDGGEGTKLITPEGLDGLAPFSIERRNDRREEKDKKEEVERLTQALSSEIATMHVSEYGSVQRLLNYSASLGNEASSDDLNVFIIWSPLLGTSSDGSDCLDVNQVAATEENASAMVDRCLDQGLITKVPNSGTTIYGVGVGSYDAEQQRFARYLQENIVDKIFSSGGTS